MKTLILLLMITAIAIGAVAQEIPVIVQSSFESSYPGAENVDWEKQDKGGKTQYTVEYKMENAKHIAQYDVSGNLIQHKVALTEEDLPMAIRTTMINHYKDYKVGDTYKVEMAKSTIYTVMLNGKEDKLVSFDEFGNVLSMQKAKK
ncbi:hypothetical protein BH09BAC1_BH09BAC1_08310 [soil metagenome]